MRSMRTFCFCLIIVAIILISALSQRYSRKVWVDSINGNSITFTDITGNLWEYESDTDDTNKPILISKWKKAILVMHTNKTELDTSDDIIIKIKWRNW